MGSNRAGAARKVKRRRFRKEMERLALKEKNATTEQGGIVKSIKGAASSVAHTVADAVKGAAQKVKDVVS